MFGKRVEAAAAGAGSVTIDLRLSFEPGYMILEGADGGRFRITREDVVAAQHFASRDVSPNTNFDPFKMAKISRWMKHGMSMDQVAALLGESGEAVRAEYARALADVQRWEGNKALLERRRLAEADNLSVTNTRGRDSMWRNGGLYSTVSGAAIIEPTKKTVSGFAVARALIDAGGEVAAAAKALQVDAGELQSWIERNADMLRVLTGDLR